MMDWQNNLDTLVDYLVDGGIDEGEINYFLHCKRTLFGNRSIMDLIREDNWKDIWGYVQSYMAGDFL